MFSFINGASNSCAKAIHFKHQPSEVKYVEGSTLTCLALDILAATALIVVGALFLTGKMPVRDYKILFGVLSVSFGCLLIPVALATTAGYWFVNHSG